MGIDTIVTLVAVSCAFVALIAVTKMFYRVNSENECIIERLGSFLRVDKAGYHIKLPFVDTIKSTIPTITQSMNIQKQPVISEDNITLQIEIDLFFQVYDTKTYAYSSNCPLGALELLTIKVARNIIGQFKSYQIDNQRHIILKHIQDNVTQAAKEYGIIVELIDFKIYHKNQTEEMTDKEK
jgi:regulator of protease activity HflC (stomatin/prohibitin superfamily)